MSREEALDKLKQLGGELYNRSSAVLAKSACGERQLEIKMVADKVGNIRHYVLYEREISTGMTFGEFEETYCIKPYKAPHHNDTWKLITSMNGQYIEKQVQIMDCIEIIESDRVLQAVYIEGGDRLLMEEIWTEFQEYLIANPLSDRILQVEINGKQRLVFRKSDFESIFQEIASGSKIASFKRFCVDRKHLLSEDGRYGYKIEREKAKRLNIPDRVYCLNLDDEFMNKFNDARTEIENARKAKEAGKAMKTEKTKKEKK